MFRRYKYQIIKTDNEHPLDSPSIIKQILNGIFKCWIFKMTKVERLKDLDDVPNLPNSINNAYLNWQQMKKSRLENNLPALTLSMIYYTEKYNIVKLIILGILEYLLVIVALFIFQNHLWQTLSSINNNNINELLGSISMYSVAIFVLFNMKSIIASYILKEMALLPYRVVKSLCMSIYKKSLSLDINECDKQQVLHIIGSDVDTISDSLWLLLGYAVTLITMIVLSMFALFYVIGISALFGVIFMICIGIPCQLYGGIKWAQQSSLKKNFGAKRIQLITELIRGIRVLKLSSYELPLMNKVNEYRQNESHYVRTSNLYSVILQLTNFLIPSIMLCIILIFYLFVFGNQFDVNVALFVIMILMITALAVRGIPVLVGYSAELIVCAQRIDDFFERKSININDSQDIDKNQIKKDTDVSVQMNNATFKWTEQRRKQNMGEINDSMSIDNGFSLNDISLRIKRNKLVAIVGAVGSGKSSLIQSILGEMKCINDSKIIVNDNIIYCSQTPYIRNITLRENIVMELEYDEIKYKQCIKVSCLLPDLNTLIDYDNTLIGDEGVTLSGGQKMRVSFARALYRKNNKNNNIFIFDDPLSCVDIFVGKFMFFNGICQYLLNRNKNNDNDNDNECSSTCLMVINSHLHLLKYFDEIIIVDKGTIKAHKSTNDLFFNDNNGDLFQQYSHILPSKSQILNMSEEDQKYEKKEHSEDIMYKDIDDEKFIPNDEFINFDGHKKVNILPADWQTFSEFLKSTLTKFDYEAYWYNDEKKITKLEEIKNNKIKLIILCVPVIFSYLVMCCAPICDITLLMWYQNIKENNDSLSSNTWYLAMWFLFLCIISFCTLVGMYSIGVIVTDATNHIHCKALYNVLRANTLFFDITPRGDIINRFTADVKTMDFFLPIILFQVLLFSSSTIGYFIVIVVVIPYSFIAFALLLPVLFYLISKFKSSYLWYQLLKKQLYAPVMTLFTETMPHLDSIRSYKLQKYFMNDMNIRINNYLKPVIMSELLYSWFILYGEMIMNLLQLIVIFIASLHLYLDNNNSNTQLIALCLWYFIGLQQQLSYTINTYVMLHKHFASAKRLMYYHNFFDENQKSGKELVHEASQINHKYTINNIVDKWPEIGGIDIHRIQLRYRKDFNIVLDVDSDINIKPGSKIGICGRTGSGKSSMLVSIFRLFEPLINKIKIDNIQTDRLGLYDLRSNLSVISQTPVLFRGTLKFNLDPFHKYSDDEIWNSLKCVDLFDLINNRKNKLLCIVEANGSNFSVGQRQLLCFARCMLEKSKIMFIDEATSSIDKNTDNIIQKLIRTKQFENITIVCIAHRIQTIIDYDYILVLQSGKIIEYDTPERLLQNENSHFSKLVKMDKLYCHK